FGIPLLEAMAAGVPVVTARRSSLPEVCGEAALYLDQDDPERLADLIREVVDRSDVAAELTARGRLRAREFLPEAIAARIGDVYERMLPGLGAERDVQVQS
ncbi:MAG: glycosyltransferase, partial [Candidatus Dadabacteria bacterium]